MARPSRPAALRCEPLEDRVTPVVAYALTGVGNGTATLLGFDTASPNLTTTVAVTNVSANERLVGIDFRPQNGHLYALGVTTTSAGSNTGTLYDISVRTGRATPVGPTGGVTVTNGGGLTNPATAGTAYVFDFNPAADAIRVVGSDGDNFAINPNTGTTLAEQTPASTSLGLTGAGYTNNTPNAIATTLYAIGSAADSLYLISSPATPIGTLVGVLGVGDVTEVNGFDIPAGINVGTSGTAVTSGAGFAALTVGGVSRLYTVNLVTGAGTLIGTIGSGAAVSGLAVQNDFGGFPAFGLAGVSAGTAILVRFNTSTPGTSTSAFVTGIAGGETLVGIDFRPNTGQLYALGVNAGGTGSLYQINPQSGAATVVGTSGGVAILGGLPSPATTSYGFDFNPAADAIRVVTSAGQSFAISPTSGAVTATAPAINGAATAAVAAAYSNSFGQAPGVGGPTTLYVLDAASNSLLIQAPASSLTTAVGPITQNGTPLDFSSVAGFDLPAAVTSPAPGGSPAVGAGYASLVVGGNTRLYRIDLATGAATDLGATPLAISAFTMGDAPTGAVRFQTTTATAAEGTTPVVALTRTSTTGPLTVTVTTTGGTATAGVDYAPGPVTGTFADGSNTATFTVPTDADVLIEGNETAVFGITTGPGVIVGTPAAFTLTLADTTPPVAPSRNLVIGQQSGAAAVFVPNASGQYPGSPAATLQPFPGFSGTLRVAGGDVNGDGTADTVLVTGPGTALRLAVISGVDNSTVLVAPFDPFGGNFTGGGFVAARDLDGDGTDEFVVTPDEGGGPRVSVFGRNADGTTTVRANFLGIDDPNFRGGARAALGDVNGDGVPDVVVSAGFGGGPRTAIFTGQSVLAGAPVRLVNDFFAFPGTDAVNLRNGTFVASSDVTGDGFADLIFGGGPGGAPRVFILSGALVSAGQVDAAQAAPVANFFVAGNVNDRGGVRVAAVDADGDARADVAAGSGEGSPAKVRVYLGANFTGGGEPGTFQDLSVLGGGALAGGVFVG
ncbi:DUF4394 domain-containing protein [Urbifossiella limnaea]|uniref:FG-GAP repeat protein n=1 Tax=Urbifossiella limnaea TaxID=2528023 RepID=A0A517XQ86_9BACT|nr:DUF4394 domain-containing protein [Urbifossiella limnaea]QDU19646.1 FG-GAP repeat protein [Urbifossiella limnaea]